jgi:hypothetical protein
MEDHNIAGETYGVIVLGAGISGLVSASILLKEGYGNIVIVDEYAQVGGNHIDCSIGKYTFDIGSFIFQSDSPLLKHLSEIVSLYVTISPTWGRLTPQGMVTQYPISIKDDLIAAGPVEWLRIPSSVLFARIFRRRLRNSRDFAQFWIGARLLHRSGLGNYMKRFYGRHKVCGKANALDQRARISARPAPSSDTAWCEINSHSTTCPSKGRLCLSLPSCRAAVGAMWRHFSPRNENA